jgi:ABC-2 type transport system permease protein
VRQLDLANGQVPPDVNVLLVVAPQDMSELQRYAVDQYLMRGGAVVVAGSNERITADPFTGALTSQPITGGLRDLLAHYGVEVGDSLVLDPQNEPFPIAVNRPVGDFTVQEIQSLDYPYFVDVRADGMAKDSAIIANLPAVTLNWVAPVTATQPISGERQIVQLLHSTPQSWTSSDANIQPDPDQFPEYGFPTADPRASQPLAVSVIGAFDSFYAGKERPQPDPQAAAAAPAGPATSPIDQSPATARLVVIGSGDFLNDTVFNLSSQLSPDSYLNSLQLVTNAVDWSVEDMDLLGIRARGAHARILDALTQDEQSFWEFINYALAIAAVVVIGAVWALRRRNERPMELTPRNEIRDSQEVGHAHS